VKVLKPKQGRSQSSSRASWQLAENKQPAPQRK
jgi:hypothetical protein